MTGVAWSPLSSPPSQLSPSSPLLASPGDDCGDGDGDEDDEDGNRDDHGDEDRDGDHDGGGDDAGDDNLICTIGPLR